MWLQRPGHLHRSNQHGSARFGNQLMPPVTSWLDPRVQRTLVVANAKATAKHKAALPTAGQGHPQHFRDESTDVRALTRIIMGIDSLPSTAIPRNRRLPCVGVDSPPINGRNLHTEHRGRKHFPELSGFLTAR